MMKITRTNSSDKDFKLLTSMLDDELHDRYGELQNFYDSHNVIESGNNVVVVYSDKIPVGCGCFKDFNAKTVEIKRMFVRKDFRGKGISKILLDELENWAQEKGFGKAVLETGTKQNEAIGLYKKRGYKIIENYGQYAGVKTSVCMFKEFMLS